MPLTHHGTSWADASAFFYQQECVAAQSSGPIQLNQSTKLGKAIVRLLLRTQDLSWLLRKSSCAVGWGQGALQDPAGKRQCNLNQACSKNKLCYFHVLVSQANVVSNSIRRKSFSLGLQHHPRDSFASAIFADWEFILGSRLAGFSSHPLSQQPCYSKNQQCSCLPNTEHSLAPWEDHLESCITAAPAGRGTFSPAAHCSGPLCVESEHQEPLFLFYGQPGFFL